jgi:hypothetical protein
MDNPPPHSTSTGESEPPAEEESAPEVPPMQRDEDWMTEAEAIAQQKFGKPLWEEMDDKDKRRIKYEIVYGRIYAKETAEEKDLQLKAQMEAQASEWVKAKAESLGINPEEYGDKRELEAEIDKREREREEDILAKRREGLVVWRPLLAQSYPPHNLYVPPSAFPSRLASLTLPVYSRRDFDSAWRNSVDSKQVKSLDELFLIKKGFSEHVEDDPDGDELIRVSAEELDSLGITPPSVPSAPEIPPTQRESKTKAKIPWFITAEGQKEMAAAEAIAQQKFGEEVWEEMDDIKKRRIKYEIVHERIYAKEIDEEKNSQLKAQMEWQALQRAKVKAESLGINPEEYGDKGELETEIDQREREREEELLVERKKAGAEHAAKKNQLIQEDRAAAKIQAVARGWDVRHYKTELRELRRHQPDARRREKERLDALRGRQAAAARRRKRQKLPEVREDTEAMILQEILEGERLTSLRMELELLEPRELKERALQAGVVREKLDEADDSDDVKQALIGLILGRAGEQVKAMDMRYESMKARANKKAKKQIAAMKLRGRAAVGMERVDNSREAMMKVNKQLEEYRLELIDLRNQGDNVRKILGEDGADVMQTAINMGIDKDEIAKKLADSTEGEHGGDKNVKIVELIHHKLAHNERDIREKEVELIQLEKQQLEQMSLVENLKVAKYLQYPEFKRSLREIMALDPVQLVEAAQRRGLGEAAEELTAIIEKVNPKPAERWKGNRWKGENWSVPGESAHLLGELNIKMREVAQLIHRKGVERAVARMRMPELDEDSLPPTLDTEPLSEKQIEEVKRRVHVRMSTRPPWASMSQKRASNNIINSMLEILLVKELDTSNERMKKLELAVQVAKDATNKMNQSPGEETLVDQSNEAINSLKNIKNEVVNYTYSSRRLLLAKQAVQRTEAAVEAAPAAEAVAKADEATKTLEEIKSERSGYTSKSSQLAITLAKQTADEAEQTAMKFNQQAANEIYQLEQLEETRGLSLRALQERALELEVDKKVVQEAVESEDQRLATIKLIELINGAINQKTKSLTIKATEATKTFEDIQEAPPVYTLSEYIEQLEETRGLSLRALQERALDSLESTAAASADAAPMDVEGSEVAAKVVKEAVESENQRLATIKLIELINGAEGESEGISEEQMNTINLLDRARSVQQKNLRIVKSIEWGGRVEEEAYNRVAAAAAGELKKAVSEGAAKGEAELEEVKLEDGLRVWRGLLDLDPNEPELKEGELEAEKMLQAAKHKRRFQELKHKQGVEVNMEEKKRAMEAAIQMLDNTVSQPFNRFKVNKDYETACDLLYGAQIKFYEDIYELHLKANKLKMLLCDEQGEPRELDPHEDMFEQLRSVFYWSDAVPTRTLLPTDLIDMYDMINEKIIITSSWGDLLEQNQKEFQGLINAEPIEGREVEIRAIEEQAAAEEKLRVEGEAAAAAAKAKEEAEAAAAAEAVRLTILRTELEEQNLSALLLLARKLSVDPEKLDEANLEDDVKGAVVALILEKDPQPTVGFWGVWRPEKKAKKASLNYVMESAEIDEVVEAETPELPPLSRRLKEMLDAELAKSSDINQLNEEAQSFVKQVAVDKMRADLGQSDAYPAASMTNRGAAEEVSMEDAGEPEPSQQEIDFHLEKNDGMFVVDEEEEAEKAEAEKAVAASVRRGVAMWKQEVQQRELKAIWETVSNIKEKQKKNLLWLGKKIDTAREDKKNAIEVCVDVELSRYRTTGRLGDKDERLFVKKVAMNKMRDDADAAAAVAVAGPPPSPPPTAIDALAFALAAWQHEGDLKAALSEIQEERKGAWKYDEKVKTMVSKIEKELKKNRMGGSKLDEPLKLSEDLTVKDVGRVVAEKKKEIEAIPNHRRQGAEENLSKVNNAADEVIADAEAVLLKHAEDAVKGMAVAAGVRGSNPELHLEDELATAIEKEIEEGKDNINEILHTSYQEKSDIKWGLIFLTQEKVAAMVQDIMEMEEEELQALAQEQGITNVHDKLSLISLILNKVTGSGVGGAEAEEVMALEAVKAAKKAVKAAKDGESRRHALEEQARLESESRIAATEARKMSPEDKEAVTSAQLLLRTHLKVKKEDANKVSLKDVTKWRKKREEEWEKGDPYHRGEVEKLFREAQATKRREAATAAGSGSSRKPPAAAPAAEAGVGGRFRDMRPYQLKAECKKNGLDQTGNKGELLERLEVYELQKECRALGLDQTGNKGELLERLSAQKGGRRLGKRTKKKQRKTNKKQRKTNKKQRKTNKKQRKTNKKQRKTNKKQRKTTKKQRKKQKSKRKKK